MDNNEQVIEMKKKRNKFLTILANVLFVLIMIVCVCVVAFKIVYVETPVVGVSMLPTMNADGDGDVVMINTKSDFDRGDIVVIDTEKANIELSHIYIVKRIIATQGERVDLRFDEDGKMCVWVNGEELTEEYETTPAYKNGSSYPYAYNAFKKYLEANSDKVDYNEDGLLISKNCIFVLGDNRCNSTDSTVFGEVNKSSVLGRVDVIVKKGESKLFTFIGAMFKKVFG